MKKAISYFIKKAADWLFRRRSPALIVFRAGAALLTVTLFGSWAVSFSYSDAARTLMFGYQSSNTSQLILNIGFVAGILLTF
ncbi:MAG: hypothetical protein ACTH5C_08445 [Pseudoalteromonas prydzensis]